MCRADSVIRPVTVIDFFPPVCRSFSFEVAGEAVSLYILHFHSGKFGQCRCKVDVEYQVFQAFPGGDFFRITDDEGHTGGFFIKHSFVEEAVFAEEVTLVGDINNDGVVGNTHFVQCFEEFADVVVYGGSATQIVADQFLINCTPGGGPLHSVGVER